MNAGVNEQIVELICEYEDIIAAAQRLVKRLDDGAFVRPPGCASLVAGGVHRAPHDHQRRVPAGDPDGGRRGQEAAAGDARSTGATWPASSSRAASNRRPSRRGQTPGALRRDQSEAAHGDARRRTSKSQRELQYLAWDSAGLDLERLKIASPFNPSVKYNLYSAYRVLGALGRRHLAQAEASAG